MSAIWGVIHKKGIISENTVSKMRNSMQGFRIDRTDDILQNKVYFACGHQYFTKEAVSDISPYYDGERGIWFLADCYLYNRTELIQLLKEETTVLGEVPQECGDAMLAFYSYCCWGEDFVKYLRGSFAFAIFKEQENVVLLYTDHVAQRYLAYYADDECVCFSSLYQPILAYLGDKVRLCEEWLAAAYTDCTADTIKLERKTVYENVFHVEPGRYIKINLSNNQTETVCYWNPLKKRAKFPKLSDDACKDLFLTTFEKVTKSLLRAKNETGIMLSGGLDSSSVAAIAARHLAVEEKKLYGYTSVPASDFEYSNTVFEIENETDMVLVQAKMYPNLVPCFVSAGDMNCMTKLQEYVSQHREPVKPALNMVQIDGMLLEAQKCGCSILLSGQNGNATISYGKILTFVYQKLARGKVKQAYREMTAFCNRHRLSRKKFIQIFLNEYREQYINKFSFGDDCFLRETDIEKYQLVKLCKKRTQERGTGYLDSVKQRKKFCFMPLVFQHMGFYDTYSSLQYGVLPLDPTLTKEMIELCMDMPIEYFVRDGKERRAIRDYMKGYVPDVILENHVGRGSQAADYAFRVNRDWDKIRDEVYDILKNPSLNAFLDNKKLQALVETIEANEYHLDKDTVAKMAVISSLGYFLKMTDENVHCKNC